MPIPTRLISLNLGSQTIGLAEFRTQAHGGLVLMGYRLREIPAELTNEETRHSEIAVVLHEMMSELRIGHGSVNYAIPAQSAFVRFVKLPLVDEEKIERIIGFEAQQNVPFPIHEVVWDYQLVGGGPDQQVEVVIVAVKTDYLEGINAAVEESGLRANKIEVATMSLYNAFKYNYGGTPGCSLLVNIGARTTNVLFVEPGRVFSRSVPIGGSSITAAIAKEFGESFAEAESRKRRDGFVSLGGAYAEAADPDVARVSKIVRTTMTRLHAELMRSISHYRAQQQGSRPDRIFLSGFAASMPYMREFFREKLQLPIEFFNPLQNVTVSESANVPQVRRSAHLLGELVGLALRSVTTCPIELTLFPASVVRRKELEKRRPFFIAAAACFLLALLGSSAYYTRAARVTRQSTEVLQQKNNKMRADETRLNKLKKDVASLDSIAAPLITAVNDRNFWPEILQELNSRLTEADIWITELAAMSGGKVLGTAGTRIAESTAPAASPGPATGVSGRVIDGLLVRGLYLYNPKQQEIVVDYFRNLAASSLFTIDPKTPERVIKSNSVPNETEWAFPYELQLTLRKPVKLP